MNSIIDNCPDGLDCPHYPECSEIKQPQDPCPLVDTFHEPTEPLDSIINDD
jgi:hypothetical protein